MLITHTSTTPGNKLADNGATYVADRLGLFNVPDDVGKRTIKFPGWSEWSGDTEPAHDFEGFDPVALATIDRAGLRPFYDRLVEVLVTLTNRVDQQDGYIQHLEEQVRDLSRRAK